MTYGYQPEVGSKIRTLTTVYSDPDGTGYLVTGNYEKLPVGSVGEVEKTEYVFGGNLVVCVVFSGGYRARLGPSAWEIVDPV